MIKQLKLKIGSSGIFLLLIVLFYIVVALVNFNMMLASLAFCQKLIWQIAPVLIVVLFFIFLANLLVDSKRVVKYLGASSGCKGWIIASVFGIISAGPIYMWYPLLSDLRAKGMKNSLIAVFLYNRAVKIPLMPLFIYYFGWPFLVILTVLMIAFSFINGWIVGKLVNRENNN